MSNAADRDFSELLDRLWDFDAPAVSEDRFRTELAKRPSGSREARETATQIARTLGLQRKFSEADATLDTLKDVDDPPRVRVRYLLERGRVQNSSGNPADAVPLFKKAVDVAAKDALPGADFYRVDALHMLGIAAPADERLRWNLEAFAVADASNDARARGWRASLLNNIGWTYHDLGDYVTALDYWQKALAAREGAGEPVCEGSGRSSFGGVGVGLVTSRRRAMKFINRPSGDHATVSGKRQASSGGIRLRRNWPSEL